MFNNHPILILEDNDDFRNVLRKMLSNIFQTIHDFKTPEALFDSGTIGEATILLLDLGLGAASGIDLIDQILRQDPLLQIIIITGNPAVDTAVEALQRGAVNYLVKPVTRSALLHAIEVALKARSDKARQLAIGIGSSHEPKPTTRILGHSAAICAVNLLVERYAPVGTTAILITGESGVGKELVAEAIHRRGPRASQPFIKINCATIPRHLAESDLFGHERGAFTDAKESKKGIFELAEGGTVMLDEIGELSMDIQPKLLRVLEEKIVIPLGSEKGRRVDVRVVAATNRDLFKHCKEGLFREDLYFRLAVLGLHVPSLRRRKEDIPILADYFLRQKTGELGRIFIGFSEDVLNFFQEYEWPGNVRELRNIVERLAILSDGPLIDIGPDALEALRFRPNRGDSSVGYLTPKASSNDTPFSSDESLPKLNASDRRTEEGDTELRVKTLSEIECDHIKKVLELCKYNRSRSSRLLGISRSTLLSKLREYGLDTKDPLPAYTS